MNIFGTSIADYKAAVKYLGFDPKAPETIANLKEQGDTFSLFDGNVFVVVNDCGPKIVAAFSFQHHAEAFVKVMGQTAYLCDDEGKLIDE